MVIKGVCINHKILRRQGPDQLGFIGQGKECGFNGKCNMKHGQFQAEES